MSAYDLVILRHGVLKPPDIGSRKGVVRLWEMVPYTIYTAPDAP